MSESTPNPFESGATQVDAAGSTERTKRPFGTIFVAAFLVLAGSISAWYVWQKVSVYLQPNTTVIWGSIGHFVRNILFAVSALTAAVGLVVGRQWGWWAALAYAALRATTEIYVRLMVAKSITNSYQHAPTVTMLTGVGIFAAITVYMNLPHVRRFFRVEKKTAIIGNILIVVLAIAIVVGTTFI